MFAASCGGLSKERLWVKIFAIDLYCKNMHLVNTEETKMNNETISNNMLNFKALEERAKLIQAEKFELLRLEAEQQAKIHANEYMQRINTIIEAALIKLNAVGWTLPMVMSIKPIEYISKLDDSKIDDFFCEFFTYDNNFNFNDLVLDLKNSKIEERYKIAVEQCVHAYNLELYIVVANTLLAVIEGILSSFYPDRKNTHMKMICKKIINEMSDAEEDTIKKYSWESYQNFVDKLYAKSSFDENPMC